MLCYKIIAEFPHPLVVSVPAEGVPLGIGYWRRGQKTIMMGYLAEKYVWRSISSAVWM